MRVCNGHNAMKNKGLLAAFSQGKRRPIAERLAERLGGEWRAVRSGFGWEWHGPGGRVVRCYAKHAPQHDGDDDTFISVYIDDDGVQVGACGMIW